MFIDDLAVFIAQHILDLEQLPDFLNVGPGIDHSILDYYKSVAGLCGYDGHFIFDTSRPVGMKQKLLDVKKLNQFGWNRPTDLITGLQKTIQWYSENPK